MPLLLHAVANDDQASSDDCPPYGDTGPGVTTCVSYSGPGAGGSGDGWPAGSVIGVWSQDVTDSTEPLAPLLDGSPQVAPVPADSTVLRVEVVSRPTAAPRAGSAAAPLETQIDTTAAGQPIDTWGEGTPHALDIHLDTRPSDVQVAVSVTAGSGTVQCRVYAGNTLVAIDTSTTKATCVPAL